MEFVVSLAGLALAGVFIGIASGLLGVGGGVMMIPVLRLVFSLSAIASTATSLFTMIFTSLSGAVTHVKGGTCIPKLGVALGLGGCLTSPLGARLAGISPSWAIMLAAAAVIIYTSFTMLRKALRMGKGAGAAAGKSLQADEGPEDGLRLLAGGFAVGLIAGFCAGYVGIGGGFVMVPFMTAWLGVAMKKASGTSLLAIIILAIPGVATQMMMGNVDYLAGIALAVGTLPGAVVGARLVNRIDERTLRLLFSAFLALAGVLLVVNEFVSM